MVNWISFSLHLCPILMLIQCWMPGGVWDEEPKVIDRGNQNQAPATPVLETHLGIFEIWEIEPIQE